MRIAIASSSIEPHSGAVVLLRLVEEMRLLGHTVEIFTTAPYSYDPSVHCIKKSRFAQSIDFLLKPVYKLLPNVWNAHNSVIYRTIAAVKPDIVHLHWRTPSDVFHNVPVALET